MLLLLVFFLLQQLAVIEEVGDAHSETGDDDLDVTACVDAEADPRSRSARPCTAATEPQAPSIVIDMSSAPPPSCVGRGSDSGQGVMASISSMAAGILDLFGLGMFSFSFR